MIDCIHDNFSILLNIFLTALCTIHMLTTEGQTVFLSPRYLSIDITLYVVPTCVIQYQLLNFKILNKIPTVSV